MRGRPRSPDVLFAALEVEVVLEGGAMWRAAATPNTIVFIQHAFAVARCWSSALPVASLCFWVPCWLRRRYSIAQLALVGELECPRQRLTGLLMTSAI